jgi:uncharacterized protein YjbI with pentapeptide repeats
MSNTKAKKVTKPKAPDWLIDNIAEASKNARKIYLIYVGILAYCALTIVSTTDRQLVLNEPARLPIIDVEVPLNGFFIISPFLMIFVFIYFQLYLNKLKRLFDELANGYAAEKASRIYPWLMNFADELKSGFVGKAQRFIVNFSLWWAMPLVLILNALWYIKKHAAVHSYILGIVPFIGMAVVILFWNYYETGQYKIRIKKHWRLIRSNKNKIGLVSAIIVIELLLIFILIPLSFQAGFLEFRGGVFEFLWPLLCVDLSYQKLVTEQKEEYGSLYWVDLRGVHLEGADLTGSILRKADLEDANLEKAYIVGANLIKARLWDAHLQGANLWGARLDSAELQGAQFQGAYLIDARLQGALLEDARLDSAELQGAQFQGANLALAQLQGASLKRVWLDSANLWFAELDSANLEGAWLQGANLEGAWLQGANLQGAQLEGVRGLSIDSLSKVQTLYGAKLDSVLMKQIEKEYPHLLEEP